MNFKRILRLCAVVTLAGSGGLGISQASVIDLLSEKYSIQAFDSCGSFVSESSSVGPLQGDFSHVCGGGASYAYLDSNGGLSTSKGTGSLMASFSGLGDASGSATATLDFSVGSPVTIDLSGGFNYSGAALADFWFTDVTDNVVLLHNPGSTCANDRCYSNGSYSFLLDASKDYRFRMDAEAFDDAASASVYFSIPTVPEPSTVNLLLSALAALSVIYRKRRTAHRTPDYAGLSGNSPGIHHGPEAAGKARRNGARIFQL